MNIDIHLHTDYSRCSRFEYARLKEKIIDLNLEVVTVTDHGITQGWERLEKELDGVLVIPGVEVRAREGDFLVYSTDSDYIIGLGPYVPEVAKIRRDENTLVIWAHPRVTSETGWQAPHPEHHMVKSVIPHIDAIEVYNANMLHDKALTQTRQDYAGTLEAVAKAHGIPMTGGSDAHAASSFMSCWTEFNEPVKSVRGFLDMVKKGKVRPGCADGMIESTN